MGFVSSQVEIYGDLDVVMAPAVGEAFGLTALEAGGWALPVIAARSGGFPETVIEGEAGLLVEPNDPADLARALQLLLRGPTERQRLGRNARRHCRRRILVLRRWEGISLQRYPPLDCVNEQQSRCPHPLSV